MLKCPGCGEDIHKIDAYGTCAVTYTVFEDGTINECVDIRAYPDDSPHDYECHYCGEQLNEVVKEKQ